MEYRNRIVASVAGIMIMKRRRAANCRDNIVAIRMISTIRSIYAKFAALRH